MRACLSALVMLTSTVSAFAGQAPGAAEQPDIAVVGSLGATMGGHWR